MLNRRKGPAVRGPRAQADRKLYRLADAGGDRGDRQISTVVEGEADALIVVRRPRSPALTLCGRPAASLRRRRASTTGTFLRGLIHIGERNMPAGRVGEAPSAGLVRRRLSAAGFALARLKTGTPPRLDGRTIDWSALEQPSGR